MLPRLQAPAATGLNPGEAVGPRAEALRGVRTDRPRRLVAQADLEPLAPPLGATGDVDPVVEGIAEIDVQPDLILSVAPRVERRGCGWPERSVDGVVDEEVRRAGASTDAHVPEAVVSDPAAQAGDQRRVQYVAPELRREAARKAFLEGEAVRIGEDPCEGRLIGPAGGDRHGRARGGTVGHAVPRVEHIADQQALPLVGAEDRGSGVEVPKEEAAGHPPAGVIGMAVGPARRGRTDGRR